MDKFDVILNKDSIQFGERRFFPPFKKEEVDSFLGEPFCYEWDCKIDGKTERRQTFLWPELGIRGYKNDTMDEYKAFAFFVEKGEYFFSEFNKIMNVFSGQILVGKKPYRRCKMKCEHLTSCTLRQGVFTLYTFLPEFFPVLEKEAPEFLEDAKKDSRVVEICYAPLKPKTNKYKLKKCDEEILHFDNFNFKLAIVQELMYNKKVLEPLFDIHEFAEEYSRRTIDIDDEGYEPIKEAVNWFKKLEIPARLADEVTELDMDAGDDIYLNICPLWDGEDSYFDLKKVSKEELSQFKSLKRASIMAENFKKVAPVFEELGIEVEDYI